MIPYSRRSEFHQARSFREALAFEFPKCSSYFPYFPRLGVSRRDCRGRELRGYFLWFELILELYGCIINLLLFFVTLC